MNPKARNRAEHDAFLAGMAAAVFLKQCEEKGWPRRQALMHIKEAAEHCPFASYNLAWRLMNKPRTAAWSQIAGQMYDRIIVMVNQRIENPRSSEYREDEIELRRVASMAAVNRGIILQYTLKMPLLAYDRYIDAIALFDNNEVAHINVAQMHMLNLIPFADGNAALFHYSRAQQLGRTCLTEDPTCTCLSQRVEALRQVHEHERTAAMPRIVHSFNNQGSGILIPKTTDLPSEIAQEIEAAIDFGLSGMTLQTPIAERISCLATLLMHLGGALAGAGAAEVVAEIMECLDTAERRPELVPFSFIGDSASYEECRAMFEPENLTRIMNTCANTIQMVTSIAGDGHANVALVHAIKVVLAKAAPSWRPGLIQTFRQGLAVGTPLGKRIAVPGGIE